MRKLLISTTCAMAFLCIETAANAQSADQADVAGVGYTLCQGYTAIRNSGGMAGGQLTDLSYMSWAQGFMSMANMAKTLEGQPEKDLNGISFADQQARLHQFCGQHPTKRFMEAVIKLFTTLPDITSDDDDK